MNGSMIVVVCEDVILALLTFGLFYTGHPTAGAWALTATIANCLGTTFTTRKSTPPEPVQEGK